MTEANRFRVRAWDGDEFEVFEAGDGQCFSGLELQQSTGLLDSEGAEIFEGDIIEFESKLNGFIKIHHSNGGSECPERIRSKVYWTDGGFMFDWQYGYEGLEVRFNQVKVIGNVHENPELVNETTKD
jgi:uncharacterized phage protein (TIGR01671 family)